MCLCRRWRHVWIFESRFANMYAAAYLGKRVEARRGMDAYAIQRLQLKQINKAGTALRR